MTYLHHVYKLEQAWDENQAVFILDSTHPLVKDTLNYAKRTVPITFNISNDCLFIDFQSEDTYQIYLFLKEVSQAFSAFHSSYPELSLKLFGLIKSRQNKYLLATGHTLEYDLEVDHMRISRAYSHSQNLVIF